MYTVPNFNVIGDVWFTGNTPANAPPDVVGAACQLYLRSRASIPRDYASPSQFYPALFVRFPITQVAVFSNMSIWELPQGSGRYYRVLWREITHLGFPNQYFVGLLDQATAAGQPLPAVLPLPPIGGAVCPAAVQASLGVEYVNVVPAAGQQWFVLPQLAGVPYTGHLLEMSGGAGTMSGATGSCGMPAPQFTLAAAPGVASYLAPLVPGTLQVQLLAPLMGGAVRYRWKITTP